MKQEKVGVVKEDFQVELEDKTWIDLDPTMQLTPAFDVKVGDKIKITIDKEESK